MFAERSVEYYALSCAAAFLAVLAVFIARRAMRRGLTYSAMAGTTWALVFIGIARVWHTVREFMDLEAKYGTAPEVIEYLLYLAGYVVFIWLAWKTEDVDVCGVCEARILPKKDGAGGSADKKAGAAPPEGGHEKTAA